MEKVLSKVKDLPGVLGVYLIDAEGNLLYVNSNLDNPPIELSYLLSSLKGYLSELLSLSKFGKFNESIISGSTGRIIFSALKNGSFLVVFAENVSNLGLVKFEIANAIDAISKLI